MTFPRHFCPFAEKYFSGSKVIEKQAY